MVKKMIKRTVIIAFLLSVVILITGIIFFEIEPENTKIKIKNTNLVIFLLLHFRKGLPLIRRVS